MCELLVLPDRGLISGECGGLTLGCRTAMFWSCCIAVVALSDTTFGQGVSSPVSNLPEVRVVVGNPVTRKPRPRAAPARPAVVLAPVPLVSPTPLSAAGIGIERENVPLTVQSLSADDFARTNSPNVTDTIARVPGAGTSDVQGNSFVQDLSYRGFVASPLQGTPQGLAIYMNGIRVNEAFGDTMTWDLIPSNAVNRTDIWASNPVFGLNALGGAVNIQMKDGFSYQGREVEVQGGSFGRVSASTQYGAQKDEYAAYFAAQTIREDGWRHHSPSEVARLYGDLGWKGDGAEIHLVASAAANFFGVVGPTPVEMLGRDYRSVYTWPQTTENRAGLVALNGKFDLADSWVLQSNFYIRRFRQQHVDGNVGNFERCSSNSSFPNALCLENDGFPKPNAVTPEFRNQFVILGPDGKPIPFVGGNVPYGTVDRTSIDALTTGASLQATNQVRLFGHENYFTTGGSVDHSRVGFRAASELGFIYPDLFVGSNPDIPGTGTIIHTLGDIGYSPVELKAQNTYYGLYAADTLSITPRLAATLGGRFNLANVITADQLGTSPELNGNHTFSRINPMAGFTYRLLPGVTAYGGYSKSNRAPTPLELGCANSSKPCLIEGFLVADPPLKQVVAHSYEAGLRGDSAVLGGRVEWKLGAFRTEVRDDIITLASVIQGRGFFQNVSATRRQGLEAGAQYRGGAWFGYANYSFIDATYQFTGDLPSPHNPSADTEGNVRVTPGKHIPGIPQHRFKAGVDYAVTEIWKIGADVNVLGSQFYVGDDANQNEKLPRYWVANLRSSYQLSKQVQLFGLVNNLFNNKYASYGRYFDLGGVAKALPVALTDPRMQTPGQPLALYAGLKVKL
jgi:iron complex outermembrane receptor protein